MTTTMTPALIETPFGFDSTAAEVIDGIDLAGRLAIVTGGASGIGIETARALASAPGVELPGLQRTRRGSCRSAPSGTGVHR